MLPKNTKYNSLENSQKLEQPAKNKQIAYVTVRGPSDNVTIYRAENKNI